MHIPVITLITAWQSSYERKDTCGILCWRHIAHNHIYELEAAKHHYHCMEIQQGELGELFQHAVCET